MAEASSGHVPDKHFAESGFSVSVQVCPYTVGNKGNIYDEGLAKSLWACIYAHDFQEFLKQKGRNYDIREIVHPHGDNEISIIFNIRDKEAWDTFKTHFHNDLSKNINAYLDKNNRKVLVSFSGLKKDNSYVHYKIKMFDKQKTTKEAELFLGGSQSTRQNNKEENSTEKQTVDDAAKMNTPKETEQHPMCPQTSSTHVSKNIQTSAREMTLSEGTKTFGDFVNRAPPQDDLGLDVLFSVFIPDDETNKVLGVCMVVSCENLRNIPLHRFPKSCLWSADVYVPVTEEKIEFRFKISRQIEKITGVFISSVHKEVVTFETELFQRNANDSKRRHDILLCRSIHLKQQAYAEICASIILSIGEISLKQSIIDMEMFQETCSVDYQGIQHILDVIATQLRYLPYKRERALCFLVFLSNLPSTSHEFQTAMIPNIIKAVECSHSHDLTRSSIDKVASTLFHLYLNSEASHPKSFVRFVDIAFPMLPSSSLIKVYTFSWNRTGTRCSFSIDGKHTVSLIDSFQESSNITEDGKLIEIILTNITFDSLVYCTDHLLMKSGGMNDITKLSLSVILTRTKIEINKSSKTTATDRFKSLSDIWMLTSSFFKEPEFTEVVSLFQKSIISVIKSTDTYGESEYWERLLNICTSEDAILFQNSETKVTLMKAISATQNSKICSSLVRLLDTDKFCHLDIKVGKSILATWFDNIISHHCKYQRKVTSQDLCGVYRQLGNVSRTKYLQANQTLVFPLSEKIYNILRKRTMKENIQTTADIEQMDDPFAENEFAAHMKTLIHDGHDTRGYSVNEIIMDISGRTTPMLINSRVTLGLCRSLMKLSGVTDNSPDEDTVMVLLKCSTLWKALFDANGTKKEQLEQDTLFIHAQMALHKVVNSIRDETVSSRLLRTSNIVAQMKTLLPGNTYSRFEMQTILLKLKTIDESIASTIKRMNETKKSLEVVCKRTGGLFKSKIETVKSRIQSDIDYITDGSMKFAEIEKFTNWVTDTYEDFTTINFLLESRMYWNAVGNLMGSNYDEWCDVLIENDRDDMQPEDAVEDIRWLFSSHSLSCEDDKDISVIVFRSFVSSLSGPVLEIYKKWWENISKLEETSISDIANYFQYKCNIQEEIDIAKRAHITLKSEMKRALLNFEEYPHYESRFHAIKNALKAFNLDSATDVKFHRAICAFDTLFEQNTWLLLRDVDEAVQIMKDATQDIDEDLILIISELVQSSALVEFIREVVNEDLRNLIDAVEEHSEQFVCESTVSDLIDIKQFLLPVLKSNLDQNIRAFIDVFTKSYANCQPKQIPAKIRACMDNVHSLKSLYYNVANKEENTKEIIKMINNGGVFRIYVNNQVCELSVECKRDKKVYQYSHSRLSDLRSRALLIMSTEEKKHSPRKAHRSKLAEHLTHFSSRVDILFAIVDKIDSLMALGHFVWCTSATQMIKPHDAEGILNKLSNELSEWKSLLENCREQFFLMNYISSEHLPLVQSYLERGDNETTVLNILRYVNPNVNPSHLASLYEKYHSMTMEDNIENKLYKTGNCVQDVFGMIPPIRRAFPGTERRNVKLRDTVLEGKLHISVLEEGSRSVLHTVLALYQNTTGLLPESNELLFCTKQTTQDELCLLVKRCRGVTNTQSQKRLFCIVNAELLPYELQFKLTNLLQYLPREENFLLAIVCTGRDQCTFLEWFHDNIFGIRPLTEIQLRNCLEAKWPNVVTLTSDIPGLGKTETIFDIASEHDKSVKTLHLSGLFDRNKFIRQLLDLKLRPHHLLHIDIGMTNDPTALDLFLFQLIITGFVASGTSAYAIPTNFVCIEVANSINNILIDSLPTAVHFKRIDLQWKEYSNMKIPSDINSPLQVVCQYLHYLDTSKIDNTDIYFHGSSKVLPLKKKLCIQLLQKYFSSASDMSFTLVEIFIKVLAEQLKKMSASIFFRQSSIRAILGDNVDSTLKSSLVRIMVDVSKEFATRSIGTCRSSQAAVVLNTRIESENTEQLSTASILAQRVQGMIQWEESNHLVVIFHHDMQTVSALFRKLSQVPENVKNLFQSQMKKTFDNLEKASVEDLQRIIVRFTCTGSPREDMLTSLASSYALTPDNLLKMILVVMRLQSNVPVVIMGETGCGKTSLVRYLATITGIELDILSIHAGTSEEEIVCKIDSIQKVAHANLSAHRWVFLDEINTCDHLGVITDLLCHHRYHGKSLSPNVSVVAACNPYRLRHADSVYTEGLQGKLKEDELSRLVYRVHPLPESLIDFVWDYGRLSDTDEQRYIKTMVGNVLKPQLFSTIFSELLGMSQKFTRDLEDKDYSVSLRDVDRTIRLVKWFTDILSRKDVHCKDIVKKAIILAMAMSYQSRICSVTKRKEYVRDMASIFFKHHVDVDETHIMQIITTEQNDILDRMELPDGIARNTALRENVFVIFVSILNRIPVFIVGKPGCSKSLSMQLIRSNLRGKDSKNDFFKMLPQLFCVSFQGSESSTSDGIVKVFEKAKRYQERNKHDNVLSVVILDEIGLAEISRFNPLKVLHGLLEPGGKRNPDVAVVGISNWALDAAKMNRALHLSRPEMDAEELYETAKSISQSLTKVTQKTKFPWNIDKANVLQDDSMLKALATAFNEYNRNQRFKNFHGLRDYYALIKYISRCTSNSEAMESEERDIIIHGLLRNFSGLPSETMSMMVTFQKHLETSLSVKIPVFELIRANIQDSSCRNLMLITQGDAVIEKVGKLLKDCGKEYVVMFGSQFEDDLTDDYNYRILSRIILCMEQGMVLILKDLESIYGSLYDMLNQNYTIVGKKKNCRVALGPYSNPMCQVNDAFKCIVLVEETNLDYSDPPFLNRFEKQQFRFLDLLSSEDEKIISGLKATLQAFVEIPDYPFSVSKALPIHEIDVLLSLLLSVKETTETADMEDLIRICLSRIMPLVFPEAIIRSSRSTLSREQPTLVQTLTEEFFSLPLHEGLEAFLTSQHTLDEMPSMGFTQPILCEELCVIFTHSSTHINIYNLLKNHRLSVEKIGAFKSEKDLTKAIDNFFESEHEYLFLQFDSRYDMHHFLLTKMTVEQRKKESVSSSAQGAKKYVYLTVHLSIGDHTDSSISQIHFMPGWSFVTLDTLEKPYVSILGLRDRLLTDIISEMCPLDSIIKEQLLWAFTRIQYSHEDRHSDELEQGIKRLKTSSLLLKMIDDFVISQVENLVMDDMNWKFNIACDEHALISGGTYIEAIKNHILDIIKKPVAVFVFKMEQEGCLESLFIEDDKSSHRRKTWEDLARKNEFCNFENIPFPTGPECYSCTTPAFVRIVPFSDHIMTQIEDFKEDFLNTLRKVKAQSTEYCDDEEHPIEIVHAVLEGYKDIITSNTQLEEMDQAGYEEMIADYFHDYCNYITSLHSSKDKRAAESLRWAIDNITSWKAETFTDSVIMLHAIYWTYMDKLDCIVKIFDLACTFGSEELFLQDIISKLYSDKTKLGALDQKNFEMNMACNTEEEDGSETPVENFDDSICETEVDVINDLVILVGNMLLPTMDNVEAIGFERWQHSVSRALPLIGQISTDMPINHKLRFCSDIASILIVPYNLETNLLTAIGDSLCLLELNDKEIFSELFNFLKTLKDNYNIPSVKLKKIISLYLHRCIHTQPENDDIFIWFFEWIEHEDACNPTSSFLLPDFHYIGSILQLAIVSQQEDEDIFPSILDGNEIWKNNEFCKTLQHCLSTISHAGKLYEGLSVLLVQIIQKHVFEEDEYNPECDEVLEKTLISGEGNTPLEQISSAALIRHTIDRSAHMTMQSDLNVDDNQLFLHSLNALLKPPSECGDQLRYGPLLYFLRKLKQHCGLRNVQKIAERLALSMSTVKHIEWSQDLTVVCLELNPLEFYCSKESSETVDNACSKWFDSTEHLKTFCDQIVTDVDKLIHIERIITAIFLKRTCVTIPESTKQFVMAVFKMLPVNSIPKEHAGVLPYLFGKVDFNHSLFHLNTEVQEPDPQIVSVLLHLMCITTLYGRPGYIFYDCIHNPGQFNCHPAQTLREHMTRDVKKAVSCMECPCRVIFVSPTDICPSCKQKQISTEIKTFAALLSGNNVDTMVEHVIYRLFVNACLICSLALRLCNESTIAPIVNASDDKANVSSVIQDLVLADWERLRKQLNLSHSDLSCLLNLLLCTNKDTFLKLRNPSDVNFDKEFQLFAKCCNDFVKNRQEMLNKHRREFASRRGLSNTMERILEVDNEYSLYGIPDKASIENLTTELSFHCQSESSFLRVVLNNQHILSLPRYITDILRWHLAAVNCMSYKVRKFECAEQTIAKFLTLIEENDSKTKLKQKFGNFKHAWNKLNENRHLLLEMFPSLPEMELMTMNSCASNCLIIDKNSVIYQVLEALVAIQNNILIEAMEISLSNDCPDFNLLSCGPDAAVVRCVSIHNITLSDVISFNWTDDYLRFSQCKPNSENGRSILYDFHKIEMEVAHELVFRKSFITNTETIPLIVFADELFRNSVTLLHRIASKITPQVPLTMELRRGVENKSERNSSYTIQLLSQIGIVLSLLNKTGGDSQISLVDYLMAWKDYIDMKTLRSLLPEPENSFKLCHIVAMYECMELKSGEEISDTLGVRFRSHVSDEIRQHFKIAQQHQSSLAIVDKALKLFVHRNFSTHDINVELLNRPLVKSLMDPIYWRVDIDVRNGSIDEDSKEAVALRHVISLECLGEHLYEMIELVKQAIEEEQANEMRISSASVVFKEKMANRSQPMRKRKKIASKLLGKT